MRVLVLGIALLISSSLWATHYFELIVYKQDTVYQSYWKGLRITEEFEGLMLTPILLDTLLGSLDTAHTEIILTETFRANAIEAPMYTYTHSGDTVSILFSKASKESEILINTSAASLVSLQGISAVRYIGLYTDSVVTHTSASIPIPRFRLVHPEYEKPKVVSVIQEKSVSGFFEHVQTWLFALVLLTVILTFVLIFKRIKS